jgi:hypothetical protein
LYCETISDHAGQVLTETKAEMREYYDTSLLPNVANLQFYGYATMQDMKRHTESIGRMMFA